MNAPLIALAAAVLLWAPHRPASRRLRALLAPAPTRPPRRWPALLPRPRAPATAPSALSLDLLAACLVAGMPVPTAIRAVATHFPPRVAAVLKETADLLALGADPAQAWSGPAALPEIAPLARGARRSARSGTALADVARGLAGRVRDQAADAAETRAQRAAVAVAAPLALCFLPAFLVLGIAPVVVGMAQDLF